MITKFSIGHSIQQNKLNKLDAERNKIILQELQKKKLTDSKNKKAIALSDDIGEYMLMMGNFTLIYRIQNGSNLFCFQNLQIFNN